jgi:hypothetical protein
MNWEAIGAIGEILGALAVVLTLGYLAVQIRYSRLSAADASRQGRAVGVRELMLSTASDPEIHRLWHKGFKQDVRYETLGKEWGMSAEAAHKLDMVCASWMWLHWGQWASTNTPDDIVEIKHIVSEFYSAPPMSISWTISPYKEMLDENFVRFVNEVLEEERLKGGQLEDQQ